MVLVMLWIVWLVTYIGIRATVAYFKITFFFEKRIIERGIWLRYQGKQIMQNDFEEKIHFVIPN